MKTTMYVNDRKYSCNIACIHISELKYAIKMFTGTVWDRNNEHKHVKMHKIWNIQSYM